MSLKRTKEERKAIRMRRLLDNEQFMEALEHAIDTDTFVELIVEYNLTPEAADYFKPPARCGLLVNDRWVVRVQLKQAGKQFTEKRYAFWCDPSVVVREGDLLVVDAQGALTIGKAVHEVIGPPDIKWAFRWIVQVIDTKFWEKLKVIK